MVIVSYYKVALDRRYQISVRYQVISQGIPSIYI
ncbi:hypothetical protein ALQ43_200042 [Pseudomonas savastanoi pv. glycinea]|uniref:Uncharacterized protein n=1 Tax=Pseudomonas savastanoi pv. glycinea TaxID=318 RepID=A0A3M3V964_PSESG|nr:hypothetical protein ALQ42_200075 [Pseudomonas savastanoi pv. glycinea]RMO42071.1 hypothetical protein ALQ43_200042 [Pseudomonas savastanoi pv. glycinea]RMU13457.1 hypothetical protein ALP34_200015 [Pseudomonas savastanoi pv. glycinea]